MCILLEKNVWTPIKMVQIPIYAPYRGRKIQEIRIDVFLHLRCDTPNRL